LDKAKNADGVRRRRQAGQEARRAQAPAEGPAPLLEALMEKMGEAGAPPAYVTLSASDDDAAGGDHDDGDNDNNSSSNNEEED